MKYFWLFFLLAFFLIAIPVSVFARTPDEVTADIQQLQQKILELKGKEDSLAKQITLLNSNISLTTLKIETIRAKVEKLTSEIDQLATEIDRLDVLLTTRVTLVLHRIPVSYKRTVTPSFGMLFLSADFSEFLRRMKYLVKVQEQETMLIRKLTDTQVIFNQHKDSREQKKTQQEILKKQLETENRQLDLQKREKQVLLDQTKNSESVYQKLLAQSFAEKQALDRAVTDGISQGKVNKGDPIALVGNSGYPGCSTGAHLHFEVQKNRSWVNAEEYLSGRDVSDDQYGGTRRVGSGSWDWPLERNIVVTQHYGKTPYSWRYSYSGGIHTGIDMVSNTSIVIRAPKEGTLYSSSQTCGSGSIIKIKYIDHGEGVLSFYLHVQ